MLSALPWLDPDYSLRTKAAEKASVAWWQFEQLPQVRVVMHPISTSSYSRKLSLGLSL